MKAAVVLVLLGVLATPALGETAIPGGPPLDARAFDALTLLRRGNKIDGDNFGYFAAPAARKSKKPIMAYKKACSASGLSKVCC